MNAMIVALAVWARLSWYDPSLCSQNPTNCYDPTYWFSMAAGHDAREWYNQALACPVEYPIGTVFVIRGSRWKLADGEWVCLDRGGAIRTNKDGSIVLDLLRHKPIWGEKLRVYVRVNKPQLNRR